MSTEQWCSGMGTGGNRMRPVSKLWFVYGIVRVFRRVAFFRKEACTKVDTPCLVQQSLERTERVPCSLMLPLHSFLEAFAKTAGNGYWLRHVRHFAGKNSAPTRWVFLKFFFENRYLCIS